MALAINTSHALYSAVTSLIAVDGNTGSLVDLKRAGVTFTVDAGVTFVDDAANGKVLRTTGADATSAKGFSFTPAVTMASNSAGFASTIFLVIAKHTGDDAGLASYKNNSPVGGNVMIYHPLPVFTSQANGRKIALSSVNTDSYDAAKTTNVSFYGDGLRHTLATTASNSAGGYSSVVSKLYIDGADSGLSVTGSGGEAVIGAFNNLNNSLWKGDFLYMVIFNRVLSASEISDLNASVGNNNAFGLVTGQPAGASAPTGTVTVGTVTPSTTSAVVNYTYSASDQTGFQYTLDNGASYATIGASPATISGLTASTAYSIKVRAINATGNGAWSSAVGFTTTTPAAVAPTGTVTIGTVSVTSSSATVNFTYSASDQTGFQYRLNSGAATTLGNSPATITGLTASTAYNLEVRAVNAAGNGAWSAVKAFTTSSAPVGTGTVTVPATFKRNTGATVSDVSSVSVIVARASDFSPVCNLSGVALSSSGILSPIVHTSIVPGTVYDVWIKDTTGGSVGWFKGATAT